MEGGTARICDHSLKPSCSSSLGLSLATTFTLQVFQTLGWASDPNGSLLAGMSGEVLMDRFLYYN